MLTAIQTLKVMGMTARRPLRIDCEDRAMQKSLSPVLDEIGMLARYGSHTDVLNEMDWELGSDKSGVKHGQERS